MTIPISGLQSFIPQGGMGSILSQSRLQSLLPQQGTDSLLPQQGRQIGLDIAGENGIARPYPQPDLGGGPSFGDTLKRAIGEVSAAQDNAQDYMQRFLRGEPVELHQVMAATEEAGIALETLVEIRNKITEAYKTVINMQG